MKNLTKILIVAICVVLLAALAVVAIYADSEKIETDATLKSVSVSAGGNVKINFVYEDFGSAEIIDVYVKDEEGNIKMHKAYNVEHLGSNKTVSVPLHPDQMRYTVSACATDADGKVGETKYYSVAQYAQDVLALEKYAEYHDDMRALLNWGAMSDKYFNEKTSSAINASVFSSGTNAIAGVTASFAEHTNGVVDGDAVKVAGYQVFLEAGNTIMRMYFTYEGDATALKATISKAGNAAVSAPVLADADGENLYYVNIYNVGVAVYDKAYTVTVSAGEDSASLTKTALEYLDTIAFEGEYTDAQRNLAKSMYQFYTRTRNMTVAECEHAVTHKMIITINGKEAEQKVCSVCFENVATHNLVSSNKVVNADGTIAYEYVCNCEECQGAVVYRKNLNALVYHADVTTVTATHLNSADYVDDRTKAPVTTIVEDGMVYTHVEARGNQVETVLKAENVPAGMVMYVKYRLNNGNAPTGWMNSTVHVTTADGTAHLMSSGKVENEDLVKHHDGWVVGRINVKGNFDREAVASGSVVSAVTLTIVHSDDLDISYFIAEPTEDNVNGLPFVYSMGDDYYMHWDTVIGSYRDHEWRKINDNLISGTKQNDPDITNGVYFNPENTRTPVYVEDAIAPEVEHDIEFSKTANANGTTTYTYTCNCEECDGKLLYRKTLNSAVYHADITTATSTVTEGEGQADVTQEITEDGMLYTHVATHGNYVQTVITAENVPATAVIYVKYRLANGTTPEGYFATNVKITDANGVEHLISDGKVENSDLIKRHNSDLNNDGWVVARVNAKGAFDREGLTAGANSNAYTITFVHRDDLDIQYIVAEPTEDNVNGLPYVTSMGDDYYLHSGLYLGCYIDSQWRKINGTSGTKQNDPFTVPENTRTPVYIEDEVVVEEEKTHDVVFGKTVNEDGTVTYTYTCNCEDCGGAVLYRKTLNSAVYHADITSITATVTQGEGEAEVSQEIAEDGMLYTHVATHGNYVQTVITAENVPATAVIYVKYRLANGTTPEGYMHSRVSITSADGVEHLISDGKTENSDLVKRHNSDLNNDGWVVARVNAKGAFDREGLTAGANAKAYTITITHRDDLDIQYIVAEPTEDNVNGLPYVYSMGDDYYLHVSTYLPSYIASQWRKINGTAGVKQNDPFTPPANTRTPIYVEEAPAAEVEHNIVFGKTVNSDGTTTYTYTCDCDECDGKVLYRKTLKSNVFHADITTITATVTQGEGKAEVSQEIAEDGMLYTHVATHGNWVQTTISSEDVPAGMVMYVKYRLANGGTPAGYMASQVIVTTSDGKDHLVSSGKVENADLVKNHKGWVVSRINVKGNFATEGLTSGDVVSKVTMTITHRDDLDIAYFIAEPTEDNVNGLPYVYSMGDDYYLHVSTFLGYYQASQWRLINGTSGVKQNDPFTPPAPTRTPVYVEEAPAGEVEHNIVFNKADNGNGTTTYTYTCTCAACENKVLYKKTLNSTVFHADITTVTASLTADGTVSIPVSTEVADDGMVYSHVDANGRQTTTVISAENVPAGMVMYVKYRLNNGSAPEGWIHSRITVTTADGVEHLVSDGKVVNEDLVKRHTGWVVSRINAKGNFATEGLTSGAVVSKVTLTITHSDDLDIQYFIAEAGENNADGLPYVYSMGDDYYLHVSTVLGSYIDSQWRLINGTSGTKQNDPFTPPAPTRTPVYVEQ